MTGLALAAATDAGAALFGGHLLHLVDGLVFFVVALAAIAVGEHLQRVREARAAAGPHGSDLLVTPRPPSWCLAVMAGGSLASAAVHYVVTPEHFAESALYGVFFLVLATAQVAYCLLLLVRPSRPLVAAGALGDLAMIALWLTTRLVAVPLGPAAGTTEPFGALDVLSSGCGALVVVAGLLALAHRPGPVPTEHEQLAYGPTRAARGDGPRLGR